MPLYDVTNTKPRLVTPEDAESYEGIKALKRRLPKQTFDKIVRTVDNAILGCKPSQSSKLVWTRSSALFGHSSVQPKQHIDHLWDNVVAVVGPDKECLKAVGGLLRWRISMIENDTWLVYRQETGEIDPIDKKKITVSEYWINNRFVMPAKPKVELNGLLEAWGAKLHGQT